MELISEGGILFRRKKVGYVLITVLTIFLFISQTPLFSQKKSEKEKEEEKTDELFKLSLEELMNIKITTAGKTEEKIADIPASVVLITREDIEIFGYRDLTEILENIPGLFGIDDYADGGTNFGVRGFWSGVPNDNMIIMINRIPQVYDVYSNYPMSQICVPVEAIDRIEVVRGPMSVVYGSGAFYGAINIITNDIEEKPVSIVSSSIGSEKTKRLFIRASGNNGDFHYAFNALYYDTYGLDKPLNEMVRDPAVLTNYGLSENHRTGGSFEDNQLYLNFSGQFKTFYFNLNYTKNNRETYFAFTTPLQH